eukprot:scaffold10957_cov79-Skeletonema_menzelii.AAC.2
MEEEDCDEWKEGFFRGCRTQKPKMHIFTFKSARSSRHKRKFSSTVTKSMILSHFSPPESERLRGLIT